MKSLGALDVKLDGRVVPARDWGSQAARELFIYLLLHPEGVSKDRLLDILAPDATPARANSLFHVTAYRVRSALYKECLQFQGNRYQLDPDMHIAFDVRAMRSAVEEANQAGRQEEAQLEALRRAANLYGGRFLDSSYAEWVISEQAALEDEFVHVMTWLASLELSRGNPEATISAAQRALSTDPSLEELHVLIVRALLALGRRGEAARRLDAYARYLQTEFAAELPPALAHLLASCDRRPELVRS